jgi:hypothetical protein
MRQEASALHQRISTRLTGSSTAVIQVSTTLLQVAPPHQSTLLNVPNFVSVLKIFAPRINNATRHGRENGVHSTSEKHGPVGKPRTIGAKRARDMLLYVLDSQELANAAAFSTI